MPLVNLYGFGDRIDLIYEGITTSYIAVQVIFTGFATELT
jgi:hypothetical protein